MDQRAEKRRSEAIQIRLRLTHDVARDELRRVLEHVNEGVELAQYIVRDVARGARLAIEEDRDVGVAKADLGHELSELRDGGCGLFGRADPELLVVDRQDESARAALLLREAR